MLTRVVLYFLLRSVKIYVFTFTLGLFSGHYRHQSSWLNNFGQGIQKCHYAIIIDAGSSGTRVNAYKFKEQSKLFGTPRIELEKEFFYQTYNDGRSSLAAFVNDPDKAASLVIKLINKTETFIPKEHKGDTLLLVKATAGLRMLPRNQSRDLLKHVNESVQKLGYDMGPKSVSILDSTKEGIYGWYTVNLLLPPNKTGTVASLDLGGGSAEMTYALDEFDADLVPAIYKHSVSVNKKKITLFSHSYQKLGLLNARRGILQLEANDNNTNDFESVCVDPIVQNEFWTYHGHNMTISGGYRAKDLTRPEAYNRCRRLVQQYVLRNMDWEPPFATHGEISAMSYFHDVAADAGIVDVERYSQATIEDFHKKALSACSSSNVEQPWECMNLVYVIVLLQDGFKIPIKKPVMLVRSINGHDVSWSLGLAYNAVMTKIFSLPH